MLKLFRMGTMGIVLLTLFVSAGLFPNTASAATGDTYQRLYGDNRYTTAVDVAQEGWDHSDYAVISSGNNENLVDALTAAPLAKAKDAPILLTEGNRLTPSTKAELKRLGVKTVYITSGIKVIKQPVIDELKAMGLTVYNLGGRDRYETSVNIAKELGSFNQIVVASGSSNVDALSVASIAASKGMPILLSRTDRLPDSVANFLADQPDVNTSYVVGGTKVVSDSVKNSLPGQTVRLGGTDRYDTNRQVLAAFKNDLTYNRLYVASGDNGHLVDALTGSSLAAKTSSPILLTGTNMQPATKDYAKLNLSPEVIALGGEAAVSDANLDQLASATTFSQDGLVIGSSTIDQQQSFTDTIKITGDNMTVMNSQLDYSIYVGGDNATLKNLTVNGTVFLDPGEQGTANLSNVTAKNIIVLSGAKESIHLDSVDAGSLIVVTSSGVRVVTTGTTQVDSTVVNSSVVLTQTDGSFGTIRVSTQNGQPVVEFSGTFTQPIIIEGNATIIAAENSIIPEVIIAPDNTDNSVTLDGNFQNVSIESGATVQLAANTSITNTVVNSSAILDASQGSFGKIEVAEDSTEDTPVIELRGTFTDTILVSGQANIIAAAGASISKVEVAPDQKTEVIELEGNFKTVEVNKEATINIGKDTTVANVVANAKTDITLSSSSSKIGTLTDNGTGSTITDSDGNDVIVPPPPSSGGGTVTPPTPTPANLSVSGGPTEHRLGVAEEYILTLDSGDQSGTAYAYFEFYKAGGITPEELRVEVDVNGDGIYSEISLSQSIYDEILIGSSDSVTFDLEPDETLTINLRITAYSTGSYEAWAGVLDVTDDSLYAETLVTAEVEDSGEPNDVYSEATQVVVDNPPATHVIYPPTDVDWYQFEAVAGTTYSIRTQQPEGYSMDTDTHIYLYDASGVLTETSLMENDDSDGLWSRIDWVAPATGTYYVKVEHYDVDMGVGAYDFLIESGLAILSVTNLPVEHLTGVVEEYTLTLNPGAHSGSAYAYFEFYKPGITPSDLLVEVDANGDGTYSPLTLSQLDADVLYGGSLPITFDLEPGTTQTMSLRITANVAGNYDVWAGVYDVDTDVLYAGTQAYAYVTDLSSNTTLSSIELDGVAMAVFDPFSWMYEVQLDAGTTVIPVVTASASGRNATVLVEQAADLPGYTVITVTAEDGTEDWYVIEFYVGNRATLSVTDQPAEHLVNVAEEYTLTLDPGDQSGTAYANFEFYKFGGLTADDLLVEVDANGDGIYSEIALSQFDANVLIGGSWPITFELVPGLTMNLRITAYTEGIYVAWAGVYNAYTDYLYAEADDYAEVLP